MEPRTNVNIINVKYIYFLYSTGIRYSMSDRNIVIVSHIETEMYNINGWCFLFVLFYFYYLNSLISSS